MLDYEWILIVFGMVVTVSLSQVMQPVRNLAKKIHPMLGTLVGCPMCFGFWAGIALNLLGYSHYGGYSPFNILFDGLLATSTSYILYCITWRISTVEDKTF